MTDEEFYAELRYDLKHHPKFLLWWMMATVRNGGIKALWIQINFLFNRYPRPWEDL